MVMKYITSIMNFKPENKEDVNTDKPYRKKWEEKNKEKNSRNNKLLRIG